VTITIETRSVDEHGRLVHAEDATAQLCLAFVRLESTLAELGLPPSAIIRLRVLAADPVAASELVEIIDERLGGVAAVVPVDIVAADGAVMPGVLIGLVAEVMVDTPVSPTKDQT